jgi:hypothetical protein
MACKDGQDYFITRRYLYRKEDLGIWMQYGHDGVAVTPRYGLLEESLAGISDDTHIGLIRYGTAHLTDRFNAMEFITTKQEKYAANSEVRAIFNVQYSLGRGESTHRIEWLSPSRAGR